VGVGSLYTASLANRCGLQNISCREGYSGKIQAHEFSNENNTTLGAHYDFGKPGWGSKYKSSLIIFQLICLTA